VADTPPPENEASEQERDRAEALIIQAQDYASAESERADKLVTLAREILTTVTLHPTGEAPYLDEWSVALEQLEDAAGEMSAPGSQCVLVWRDERGGEICRSAPLAPGTGRIGIPLAAHHCDLIRERGNG
jgi:hypothetical protein